MVSKGFKANVAYAETSPYEHFFDRIVRMGDVQQHSQPAINRGLVSKG